MSAHEEGKTSFLDLGVDIIISGIIPFLDVNDIKSLSLVSTAVNQIVTDPSVWRLLYIRTFGFQPNPFSEYKWPEMYKWRATASLFTWGQANGFRLGYDSHKVPDGYGDKWNSVYKPLQVPGLENTVLSDIAATGFNFVVLSANGKLYCIGRSPWGEEQHPELNSELQPSTSHSLPVVYLPPVVGGPTHPQTELPSPTPSLSRMLPFFPPVFRHPRVGGPHAAIPGARPAVPSNTNINGPNSNTNDYKKISFFSYLPLPDPELRITSVSCGREEIIVLDDNNGIWYWGKRKRSPVIKVTLPGSPQSKIIKLATGWTSKAAVVQDVGILVWKELDSYGHANTILMNGTNNFFDPDGPNIVDIMCGETFIIFLTSDGILYRCGDSDVELDVGPYILTTFQNYLKTKQLQYSSKFVKISGSFRTFAAFSDTDDVVIGTKDSTTRDNIQEPIVIDELQSAGCISVAIGDYHFLALLRGGKLLSWGREPGRCGALGLGEPDHLKENGVAISLGRDLVVEKPHEVQVEGKVLAIAAGGWQSAAIMTGKQIS